MQSFSRNQSRSGQSDRLEGRAARGRPAQRGVIRLDADLLVNNGHECLVAQVYDPVSDPVVAPFNPVQDRHVGQRNITVVQVAASQVVNFNFFSQNLSFAPANTLIEVQKLEGEALQVLALSLGREPWPLAGAREVDLSRPVVVRVARRILTRAS